MDTRAGRRRRGDGYLADIAWDAGGWVAVRRTGHRAVLVRTRDGTSWAEEQLPSSEPVQGILDVGAYKVVPGRWSTLVLGTDRAPSCAEEDDFCPK
jgi:hypothetical protein